MSLENITFAARLLTALGLKRPESALMGPEGWIAWATMLVCASAGYFVWQPTTLLIPIGLATICAVILSALTTIVMPLKRRANEEPTATLGGFWMTAGARKLLAEGRSFEQVRNHYGFIADNIFPAASRAASRGTATAALAGFALSAASATSFKGPTQSLQDATMTFSNIAAKELSSTTSAAEHVSGGFDQARATFETAWKSSSERQKVVVPQQTLYDGLNHLIEFYRLRETNSFTKPVTFYWTDEAVRYFQDTGNRPLLVKSICVKAAAITDLGDFYHRDPQEFRRHSQLGSDLMARALDIGATIELSNPDKARILRLWSKFQYQSCEARERRTQRAMG